MCSYNNSIKTKITPAAFLLLLLCGVSCGIADFSQKLFTKTIPEGSAAAFNFYTYLFSGLVLVIALLVMGKKEQASEGSVFRRIFGYILAMAFFLFANSYFKTLAAEQLDAVLLYPLNQGCSLILASVMSVVAFKEKLTVKAALGITTAFVGLLIINLL